MLLKARLTSPAIAHAAVLSILSLVLTAGSCKGGGRSVIPPPSAEGDGNPATSANYPKAAGALRIVQYNVGVFSKDLEDSSPMIACMMKELGADAISLNELDSCNRRHPVFQLKVFTDLMNGSGTGTTGSGTGTTGNGTGTNGSGANSTGSGTNTNGSADGAKDSPSWTFHFARAMAWNGGAYGVGAAVCEEKLRSFSLSLPKGSGSEPRACAVIETPRYVLASTHLDHRSREAAVAQAALINEELGSRYKDGSKPVFLCGDMNALPDSQVLAELAKCWTVISTTGNTFTADNPSKCIDYILLMKGTPAPEVLGTGIPTVFESGDVKTASDHLPIFVDIKLKTK